MKKIIILGSCGAGKSSLAKKLGGALNIEVIHLDQHYWKPNWERSNRPEFRKKVRKLVQGDKWIMDGNYRNTLDIRLPAVDTVIFLNLSRFVCLYRIIKRRLKKDRADVISGCGERVTWELLKWILFTFPQENKKEILEKLEKVKGYKKVFILKNNKDVNDFLLERK